VASTTTTQAVTTTEAPTTTAAVTTTEAPTTTVAGTATEAPTTTVAGATTVPVEVTQAAAPEETTTDPPTTTTTTAAPDPTTTTVLGSGGVFDAGPQLPSTGVDWAASARLALVAFLAGAVALVISRRRGSAATDAE
jgi:hypothetical protein